MELRQLGERLRRAWDEVRLYARAARRRAPPRPGEPRLGVALGGGFARSLAHIGVLKALEEEGIRVACLAGTSAGSIIAGAYASGASLDDIARVAQNLRWKDFASWTISRMGLASNQRLEALVRRLFRALRFEDLQIPLAIVATDLARAEPVVFTSGELALPVRGSCAYPGLFLPVPCDGGWLVDGGLTQYVPAAAARALGATVVIGVSLENLGGPFAPAHIADVLGRSFSIAQATAEPLWRSQCDLVVEPDVSQFGWNDFARADELIAAGAAAMRAALPALRGLLAAPQGAVAR